MILFSYTCIAGILTFVAAAQADIQQFLNTNELPVSNSNEQVTRYIYGKTIQSATTKNDGNYSITTNISTEIAQEIYSTKELDLNNLDSTNLNSELNVELTDKLNRLYSDYSDKLSDNNLTYSFQSSNYTEDKIKNTNDLNEGIPTSANLNTTLNGSQSSAKPTSPNGNLTSISSTATNVNGTPSQSYLPLPYPAGLPRDINIGVPSYPQTSNPNSNNSASKINHNGGAPTATALSSNSNGSIYSISPNSSDVYSLNKLSGQDFDSTRYKPSDNTSNYHEYIQNTADQKNSYPYVPNMNTDLNNQIIQKPFSTLNFQKTVSPDQFSYSPDILSTFPDENTNGSPSGGDTGLNTPPSMNGSPQKVDQTPTGVNSDSMPLNRDALFTSSNFPQTEYSSMISKTYGSLNYKYDTVYESPNTDGVLNDDQLNMDDTYISNNLDYINIDRVNNPLPDENYGVYKDYFYERSSDGNYGTQNDNNIFDDYFKNFAYNTFNLQGSPYNSYAPNLNNRYENNELQYQNSPSFDDNTFTGNILVPYDTTIDHDNIPQMSVMNADLYKYDNTYYETNIGIDESIPEKDQFSTTDFNPFSNTQIPQTTYDYLGIDLTSARTVYDLDNGGNIDNIETVNSNYIDQVNKNDLYDAQGFNKYIMPSISIQEYNQLIGDSTSSSNTGTNANIKSPEGPYLTPQLLNSGYYLPTGSDLNKQGSNLNKQNSDSNLLIDNAQFKGYLYRKSDVSNVNNRIEDSTKDNYIGSPINAFNNRLNSTPNTVSRKNNTSIGQNDYGAKGQVIGKIYKPSNNTVKNKYSRSSYSSSDDSEFSDDMHALGNDIKRAARDGISNVHDNLKADYDTTKAVGKAIGNNVRNATNKAEDGVEKMAKTAYHGSKNAVKAVGNDVGDAVNTVDDTAENAYHASKDAVKAVGNSVGDAVNTVDDTAKTAYHASKDATNTIKNDFSDATDTGVTPIENSYL